MTALIQQCNNRRSVSDRHSATIAASKPHARKYGRNYVKPLSSMVSSQRSTQKCEMGEGWAEYADELRVVANRTFPDLNENNWLLISI